MSLGTEPFLCNVSRERLRTNSRDPQPRPQGLRSVKGVTKSKKNSKMTNRHQNAVEYIAGKSFLFISLKKK